MILWTFQPLHVWEMICTEGVYRCDPEKSSMPEPEFAKKYNWLICQMKKCIGAPPQGIQYPVWAWYKLNNKRRKPDLRIERWCYGTGGEKYACIEFEVPDDQVLLSDFDEWSIILLDGLLAGSEAEADKLDAYFESLTPEKQILFKEKNWEKAFDLTPVHNKWMIRGENIQATLWQLQKSMVRDVRFFITGKRRNDQ
ncbi:MAG: DUF3841 domain-containing protein [Clostridia bacterium]|nr:DUF3841 domain-containing protein [Clostridia bacterium]